MSVALDLSMGGTEFPRALEVRQKLYENATLGTSTRYRTLDRLDAHYKCLEHVHHDIAWDGSPADKYETISPDVIVPFGFVQPIDNARSQKPISQRRPTAPMRLTPMVVDRFTGLLFSKDRTPKVTVEGDDAANDFLTAVFKKARFWRAMYQARTFGGAMGSSLVTTQLRRSRFSYTPHSPKCVQDILWEDADLKIPAGALIQYIFVEEREVLDSKGFPTGKRKPVPFLYRRIIDEEWDLTFKPSPIVGPQLPPMQVDMHQSYQHGLGRFPGVWIQNLPSDDFDGIPDCDGAFQMFDTIDKQVAQSNKGLLYNQDPTLVYGRDKKYEQMGVPLKKGSENALNVGLGGLAQYLEISGAGISAAREFVKDLKQAAMDKVQCVVVDPEKIAGSAQSGKAIEYIYGPMLEKAGRLREQYGEAIEQLSDITLDFGRRWADPLKYEGNVPKSKIRFDLPPRAVERDEDPNNPDPAIGRVIDFVARHPGEGGIVSLAWGSYFAETPSDQQTQLANLATAYQAGGIDQETFVRGVARILKIEDSDGLLRRVREEAEQKKAEALGDFDSGDDFDMAANVQEKLDRNGERFAGIEAQEGQPPDENDEQAAQITKASDIALNGAQVTAAKEIILEVGEGKLPRETGVAMLIEFFNIPPPGAERLMGPVGETFFVEPEPKKKPGGFGGPPPPPPA